MANTTEQAAVNVAASQGVEPTRLPDMSLYKNSASAGLMVKSISGADWMEAMQALASRFEAHQADDLALAVFAAYVTRVSEASEAAFGLKTRIDQEEFAVFSIGVTPEDSFEEVLGRVVRQRMAADMRDVSADDSPTWDGDMPVAVTMAGDVMPVDCEMHLQIMEDGALVWHHNAVLDGEFAAKMTERMTAMVMGAATQVDAKIVRLPVMSKEERDLVLHGFNDTVKSYDYDGGLIASFERQVELNPDHPAVIFKGEALSYAEFNARTNRLARVLRTKGVGKDTFVGLCMERSHELLVGMWATLKAGGAYVPLNTEDPQDRVHEIIEDCRPKVVLTQERFANLVAQDMAEVMEMPEGGDMFADEDASNLDVERGFNDLAYMIYTSGSTGKPKGVVVEHGAIHNRVVWMHEEYGLEPDDRVLQKTPYTFDVSVWEFLWSFSVGSTLVVSEPGGHTIISYLFRLILQEKVTHLHFVPSVLRLFLMAPMLDKTSMKHLFCSGEALPHDLVQSFYEKASDVVKVNNLYGPTEAAVDVSYWECPRDNPDGQISIGKPVTNTGLYILDERNEPCPVGVPGELMIGGVQLARGYWAREDLTEERFVANPVAEAKHERLYKTGDLAYFRPNGDIMYMGRNDFQVKINGVRMELGEIEAAMREVDGIRDVVVLAEEVEGNKVLIAYVVCGEPSAAMGETMKQAVADRCPVFYVPKEVRFLSEMPLSTAGKVNRKVLAEMPRI